MILNNKIFHTFVSQKDLIGILILRVTGALFSFLIFFFLSRLLSSNDYGEFSYSYNLIALISILSYFGFEFTLIKFIPRYIDFPNKIYSILAFNFVIGIILTFIAFISLSLFRDKLNVLAINNYSLIPIICLSSYFFLIRFIGTTSLNAVNRPFLCQVLDVSFISIFSFIIFIIFLLKHFNYFSDFDFIFVLYSCLSVAILVALFSLFLINQKVLNLKFNRLDLTDKNEWLKTSIPIYIRDISNLSFDRGDIFFLGMFVEPFLIGYYFTSQKIVSIIDMCLDSILIKIRSSISQNILKKNFFEVNRIIKKVSLINFFSCILFALFIFSFSEILLLFFNIESILAVQVLVLIAILHIFISPFNYIVEPLIYANKQIHIVAVGIFYNILNIFLVIFFMQDNSIITFIIIVYSMRILSRFTLLPIYYFTIVHKS